MSKVYRVIKVDGAQVIAKRTRRIRGSFGLKLTYNCKGRELDYFMIGNDKYGYTLTTAYVYLMTNGKEEFIVVERDEMIMGEAKTDKIVWVDGSESRITYK